MTTPPPLPPPLPDSQPPIYHSSSTPKKRSGSWIGCLGIGVVCFFGIGIYAMVDSNKRRAEFDSNKPNILAELQTAADAEDFKKVLEIGKPYTNFGDPDIDALLSEAKEATSFFGSSGILMHGF